MATESGPAANQNPQLDLNVQADALTPTSQSGAGSGVSRDPVESNQAKSEDSRPIGSDDYKQDVPSTSNQIPNSTGSPKSSHSPNSGRPGNGENSEEEDGSENVKTDPGDGSKWIFRATSVLHLAFKVKQ